MFWQGQPNYWLTPDQAIGKDDQLVLDIGCEKLVNGFYIRNTHHAHYKKRGTNTFSIDCQMKDNSWETIMTDSLEDARVTVTETTFFFPLTSSLSMRYIRFQVDSFYDMGGGLQYFSENEQGHDGVSYKGFLMIMILYVLKTFIFSMPGQSHCL